MPRSNSWGFPRWGGYGTDNEAVTVRTCEWEGCEEKADHPAPKYRDSRERYWFCQEHAGEYNRSWNYFDGMSKEEAEKYVGYENNEFDMVGRGRKDVDQLVSDPTNCFPP